MPWLCRTAGYRLPAMDGLERARIGLLAAVGHAVIVVSLAGLVSVVLIGNQQAASALLSDAMRRADDRGRSADRDMANDPRPDRTAQQPAHSCATD